MTPALALATVSHRQHGLFTSQQLAAAGYKRAEIERRLREGEWRRWTAGLFSTVSVPASFEQRCLAATLATSNSFISHETAGRNLQMRMLDPDRHDLIVLTVPHGVHSPFDWVRLYHSSQIWPETVTLVNDIPTTTIERTLVDLANVTSPGRMGRILDDVLERGTVDLEHLIEVHRRLARRGRNGAGRIRPLLEERGVGVITSSTKLESKFRRFLHRHGFPGPDEQVGLHRDDLPIGVVDFLWRREAIVIEVDGRLGHLQRSGFEKDRRRDQEAAAVGLLPLRVTWQQLTHEESRLRDTLRDVFRLRSAANRSC